MPRQAIVQSSLEAVEIVDRPIPVPQDREIVIRVIVSGTNPKDWKYPVWKSWAHNSGDDIAGIVHATGKDVYEFRAGDRVAALHEFGKENGSFAEYAVAPDWTTFHVPKNVSFEEAATIPVAAMTAAVALYADMRLPAPYDLEMFPAGKRKFPLVVYGVTSSVGAFAAKLARLSGLYPIIGIAGQSSYYASTLVDYVVDYRQGEDALVANIESILTREELGPKATHVFDAISEGGTIETTTRFLDPRNGVVSTVLPAVLFAKEKENFKYAAGVKAYNSAAPFVHSTRKDFGYIWSRYLGRLLGDKRLQAQPFEIVPGGLAGVLTGLQNLRDGKASGLKYVYRIEETSSFDSLPAVVGKQTASGGPFENSHPLRNFPFPA